MADLDAIRRGLAANLKQALPGSAGQVSPYMLDNPTVPSLQVIGLDEIEYDTLGFGRGGDDHFFILEAALGRSSDTGAQRKLVELLSTGSSVKEAAESDGRLTKRLLDDGTVLEAQAPAAEYVHVTRYRGQSRFAIPSGPEVLLASWVCKVGA